MTSPAESLSAPSTRPTAPSTSPAFADKAGDLLPLFDFASVLTAVMLSTHGYALLVASTTLGPELSPSLSRLGWIASVLAPFMLYDAQFAARADRTGALLCGFLSRTLMFLGVMAAIGFAGGWLDQAPPLWIALWLLLTLGLTGASRVILSRVLQGMSTVTCTASDATRDRGIAEEWPVTVLADRPIRQWSAVFKSCWDLMLSTLISLLLLPLLACIALVIRLDSPGPVLFKQRRHGFNNTEFDIYKFRTMRSDPVTGSDSLQQTARGDARITRVGGFLRKWSLDELPQVFNVLEGSMSLVGPRPHAVNMRTEAQLGEEIIPVYPHRHRVKPGITGWSQINGARGATDTVEQLRRRVELDLYYIEHWSPLLDIRILTRTFKAVLRATNAY